VTRLFAPNCLPSKFFEKNAKRISGVGLLCVIPVFFLTLLSALNYIKLGIAGIPREQFPRSILVTSSRGCLWHITRKSDEDATRMLATATCPQQVMRVGLVDLGERHDTRTIGQH